MILWRVSNNSTLDGSGGLRTSGRWHTRGRRVVYCAPNPATALLEVLVHATIDVEDVPVNFRYLEIQAADSVSVASVSLGTLGRKWHADLDATRRYGDEWLLSGRSALLRVPSVVAPATWNMLVNPRHPDSGRIRIVHIHEHPIDLRLLR